MIRSRPSLLPRTVLATTPPLAAGLRAEVAASGAAFVFEKPFNVTAISAAFRR